MPALLIIAALATLLIATGIRDFRRDQRLRSRTRLAWPIDTDLDFGAALKSLDHKSAYRGVR